MKPHFSAMMSRDLLLVRVIIRYIGFVLGFRSDGYTRCYCILLATIHGLLCIRQWDTVNMNKAASQISELYPQFLT